MNIFVDPHSPGHASVVQHISSQDMASLKGLWSRESGILSLGDLEAKFFPKASRTQRIVRSSSSQVSGKTYSHGVKILTTLDPEHYTKAFDCLARHAINQTPIPPSVSWDLLNKAVRGGSASLTSDVLCHIMFWFGRPDLVDGLSQNSVYSWTDLLSAGPFATRPSLSNGLLLHVDKSPNEASRHFVQNLFDMIRSTDGVEQDWEDNDKAAMRLVRLPLLYEIKILTSPSLSTTTRFSSERQRSFREPSAYMLSRPFPISCMAQGC